MYNRYIPQPDGSYRRNFIQDSPQPPRRTPHQPAPQPCEPPRQQSCPPEKPAAPASKTPHRQKSAPPKDVNIGTFLKQLLPGELDTGDLLVIILLLLMSGDCPEDRNHALLTLFLYLFL